MSDLKMPQFANKQEKFNWLIANEKILIAQKTAATKQADAVYSSLAYELNDGTIVNVNKATPLPTEVAATNGAIKIKAVINTTNFLDSHKDVHIPKIWNMNLKQSPLKYLVKEHSFCFDGIIADEIKAYVQTYTWKELGYNYEGTTEALIFPATIQPNEQTGMYSWYKANKVKQHSVGMQYVKIYMCLNSDEPEHTQHKENYDKFIKYIANASDFGGAENIDYFWAVTEAKCIEGSCVLSGSNSATPTIEVATEEKKIDEIEIKNTQVEPLVNTLQKPLQTFNSIEAIKNIKIKFN